MTTVVKKVTYLIMLFIILNGIVSNVFWLNDYGFSWANALILLPVFLILFFYKKAKNTPFFANTNNSKTIFFLLIFIIFLVEFLFFFSHTTSISHDALRIKEQIFQLINGNLEWGEYFQEFPQNVLPTIFYSWIFKIVPISIFYPLIAVAQTNIFLFLTFINVYIVRKSFQDLVVSAIIVLFLPFLWLFNLDILYTDTPILIGSSVVILLLQLIYKNKRLRWWTWLIFGIIVFFTFNLKASFLFAGISLFVIMFLFLKDEKKLKNIGMLLISFMIAIIVGVGVNKIVENTYQYQPNMNLQFPVTHWIAMSLNPISNGVYNQTDAINTSSIVGKQNKTDFTEKLIVERLTQLGPTGLINRLFVKSEILLYGGNIYSRYAYSYTNLPKLVQNNFGFFSTVISLLSKIGYLLILIPMVYKLLKLIILKQDDSQSILFLLPATALLLFYVLLWEVNPRYGEPILAFVLPFLFVDNSLNSISIRKNNTFSIVTGIGVLSVFLISIFSSQLISKFSAAPTQPIAQGTQTTDSVYTSKVVSTIGNSAHFDEIEVHDQQNFDLYPNQEVSQYVTISGENFAGLNTSRLLSQEGEFQLKKDGVIVFQQDDFSFLDRRLAINKRLTSGKYQLVWKNTTNHIIQVPLQFSSNFSLDRTHVEGQKNWYFVYQFVTNR